MVKFPKITEDISKYAIIPFPDRKEIIINHLEMISRRLVRDLRNNITTHIGKPCNVSFGMTSDTMEIESLKIKEGNYALYLQGPTLTRTMKERITKFDDLHIYDPITGKTRVYAERTCYNAQFTVMGLADIIENLLSDLYLFFDSYPILEINEQRVEIWNYKINDNVVQPYYFSNVRPIFLTLDLFPIYMYNIYKYEETEKISDIIINLNVKSKKINYKIP